MPSTSRASNDLYRLTKLCIQAQACTFGTPLAVPLPLKTSDCSALIAAPAAMCEKMPEPLPLMAPCLCRPRRQPLPAPCSSADRLRCRACGHIVPGTVIAGHTRHLVDPGDSLVSLGGNRLEAHCEGFGSSVGVSPLLGQLVDSSIAVELLLGKEAPPNVLGRAVGRHPAEGEFDIWSDRTSLPEGPGAAAKNLP